MTRAVRIDPDLFPEPLAGEWDEFVLEVDDLLEWMGADTLLRKVVHLRLMGRSNVSIATRCGLSTQGVADHLEAARELLVEGGVVDPDLLSGKKSALEDEPAPGVETPSGIEMPGQTREKLPDQAPDRVGRPGPVERTKWGGYRSRAKMRRRQGQIGTAGSGGEVLSRSPLHARSTAVWNRYAGREASTFERVVLVCSCCEAQLRPLSPAQSFGWRGVYQSEIHRYAPRRR